MALQHFPINEEEQLYFREFMTLLAGENGRFLLRNDILILYSTYSQNRGFNDNEKENSSLYRFLSRIQEAFVTEDYIILMHRYSLARYRFYSVRTDGEHVEEITVQEYLDRKDYYTTGEKPEPGHLHIDMMPFYDYSPSLKDPKNIGNGIRFLNRYMSSRIFNNPEEWNSKIFQFLKMHSYNGQQLLINGALLQDYNSFFRAMEETLEWLGETEKNMPLAQLNSELRQRGFEPGWGNTVERVQEHMQLLFDLVNEPDDELLENFISKVPMPLISRIAILSPHGWFAQENVLGRPDTGGQVIYILDQVRALEHHLKEMAQMSGLDVIPQIIVVTRLIPEADGTTCDVRKEKIHDTENSYILRIPFRDHDYNIVPHWISRFHIWPYLENFATDTERELQSEFQARPDLIIGNYSDGNLVASILSDRMKVVQCTIAHALEKTKYLFSDIYWKDFEENYNFSIQFTVDMLAMNKSDFIITSTRQEIFGTENTMGQYESYQFFTMPGHYQVINGVNLFAPKFNVIPPGVDERVYFPHDQEDSRMLLKKEEWEKRLFDGDFDDIHGHLTDTSKTPVFTMARFDTIKNITGLIESFGMSDYLREKCNLIFAAGFIDPSMSKDTEEREQIERAHYLIDHYGLEGSVRWLPSIRKLDTGEVYRIIADHKGLFVQPALFEAFGLTILEAMLSGLPTVGTMFGGPMEIIEHGKNGFLINTSQPGLMQEGLEESVQELLSSNSRWDEISRGGVERVRKHYNWRLHSKRLVDLAKLYGFWRFSVSEEGKVKMDRYNDLLYHFLIRDRS